jgi:hypothetical protein
VGASASGVPHAKQSPVASNDPERILVQSGMVHHRLPIGSVEARGNYGRCFIAIDQGNPAAGKALQASQAKSVQCNSKFRENDDL